MKKTIIIFSILILFSLLNTNMLITLSEDELPEITEIIGAEPTT